MEPYRSEYADQAKRLCLLRRRSEEEIAFFFGVNLADIAFWAWEHREFFDAITPPEREFAAAEAARAARRDKINEIKRRCRASPSARIRNAMSARLWAAIKGRCDGALFGRLGYSLHELMSHIESQFRAGMSWQNYGKWHIDHKKPCVLFDQTDPMQFSECWALSNLQPLWATENLRKSSRYGT